MADSVEERDFLHLLISDSRFAEAVSSTWSPLPGSYLSKAASYGKRWETRNGAGRPGASSLDLSTLGLRMTSECSAGSCSWELGNVGKLYQLCIMALLVACDFAESFGSIIARCLRCFRFGFDMSRRSGFRYFESFAARIESFGTLNPHDPCDPCVHLASKSSCRSLLGSTMG